MAVNTEGNTVMSLESGVAAVLRNDPVGRINFRIDNISICKAEMEKVAMAIDNNSIAIEKGNSGAHLGASYTSWKTRRPKAGEKKMIGKITVSSDNVVQTILGKAAIFHESVHALMDVNNLKVPMHNDEVVAYIADAMYLAALAHKNFTGTKEVMAIFNAANALIKSKKLLSKPGAVLKWPDCDALRVAIKAHPAY